MLDVRNKSSWVTSFINKFKQKQQLKVGSKVILSNGKIGIVHNGTVNVVMTEEIIPGHYTLSANICKYKNSRGEYSLYIVEVLS